MKKTLIVTLALLLVLPLITSAENNQGRGNNPRSPEARDFDRPLNRGVGIPMIAEGFNLDREDLKRKMASSTEDWQDKMKDYREQIKNERENRWQNASTSASTTPKKLLKLEKREERMENRLESRRDRVGLYADYLLQRLERQINNVANLITRSEQRTQIMADSGKDVSQIQAKITQANQALNLAKDKMALLPDQFENLASSTASSTRPVQIVKQSAQAVLEAIRSAHRFIVEAITMINNGQ
ncbi:MAG: hypothetical protein COX02_00145 [Candidatus Vogelbacteria bacterium CG22_combo_CG10-13_8_21_14_all_37_9]|uniref:DUF5667 domain-containing protein n=1 Tax=Candidatus Vogelbacteria bacterium CG22_combo_CG10-13_8_21_14_all_37_9 TaxID=1975046 RepID=A0A2H0BLA3_9BACT|nr:MAG: hypothetical protein COX02_00145 [Candidatus Vogelbacteria bacterium CG22_combo_CG10-13_8_21_14_all_37_9]